MVALSITMHICRLLQSTFININTSSKMWKLHCRLGPFAVLIFRYYCLESKMASFLCQSSNMIYAAMRSPQLLTPTAGLGVSKATLMYYTSCKFRGLQGHRGLGNPWEELTGLTEEYYTHYYWSKRIQVKISHGNRFKGGRVQERLMCRVSGCPFPVELWTELTSPSNDVWQRSQSMAKQGGSPES